MLQSGNQLECPLFESHVGVFKSGLPVVLWLTLSTLDTETEDSTAFRDLKNDLQFY